MGIVRNFINIEGIISEEDIPTEINGQIIRYSDIETLYVPQEKPEIKNIYEIFIDLEIKLNRVVHAPFGNIFIIDGIKKYKIIYTEKTKFEKASILYLQVPYNTFIELPKGINNIWDIKVYILDAYFDLLDSRKIYGYFVYLVDVHYDRKNIKKHFRTFKKYSFNENDLLKKIDYGNLPFDELSISDEKSTKENKDVFIDIEEEIL